MAKGQKRSNKEIRKPKQDKKPKSVVVADSASPMKPFNASGYSVRKK